MCGTSATKGCDRKERGMEGATARHPTRKEEAPNLEESGCSVLQAVVRQVEAPQLPQRREVRRERDDRQRHGRRAARLKF